MKRVTYTFDDQTLKQIEWLQNNLVPSMEKSKEKVPASTVVRVAIKAYFEQQSKLLVNKYTI